MFSKSYCPYCKASKTLLTELGAKFYTIELDQVGTSDIQQLSPKVLNAVADLSPFSDDGSAIQDALEGMTGQRSVPNIFIAKKHIGGNSDLQSQKKDLPDLLKDAGAV